MNAIDAGHKYELPALDWVKGYPERQTLTFVKRCDSSNPERYPGNMNSYPGTTLQMVLRVTLDRINYLQAQKWCVENVLIALCLKLAIWLLEERAARRHGVVYWHGLRFATSQPVCESCGHTICDCEACEA